MDSIFIQIVMHIHVDSHAYILEKENKKEQAQQPPSLHGRSDTPNSWKEKKKMSL